MSQMNNSAIALVPLERVDNSIFPRLGHVLWSWPLCAGCGFGQQCSDATCAARVKRLRRFFQFYTAVVEAYVNESSETSRVLKTHEDLYNAVLALKGDPEMTRIALSNTVSQGKASSPSDIEAATTLAVKVLLMVDCSALHQSSNRLKKGISKVHWKDDVPFNQYLRDLFPVQTNPIFSSAGSDLSPVKSELRATKLKKHLHITLQATHDVRNHLRFDRKNNVLEVFHYTAFLKEQLKLTKGKEDPSDPMTSIKVGSLPRQLVLEVLDSLQGVLFPLSDLKSRKLLQSLVDNCAFDPDITAFEHTAIRGEGEDNVSYVFLADRLSDLYSEVENPQPRGWLERQLQRRSGARYMLLATLIGVIFAVFLGILSLVVTSYQTWIAYQAWQHPVSTSTITP